MIKINIVNFLLSLTVLSGDVTMKIMHSILFSSFALVFLSALFFNITFFQWMFGLSLLTAAISSVIVSSTELANEEIPDPYRKEEYPVD